MHFTAVPEGARRLPEGLPEAVQETSGAGRCRKVAGTVAGSGKSKKRVFDTNNTCCLIQTTQVACSTACFAHLGGEWCCEVLPKGCQKQQSFESAFVLQVVSGGLGWAAFRRLSVGFLEVAEQIAKQIQNKFVNNSRSRKTCSAGRLPEGLPEALSLSVKNPAVPEAAGRLPERLPEAPL